MLLGVYVRKELRSLFRDRHIVVYGLLLPFFMYPAMLFGVSQVKLYSEGLSEAIRPTVALVGTPELIPYLRRGDADKQASKLSVLMLDRPKPDLLRSGGVDVVISSLLEGRMYQLEYDSSRAHVGIALARIIPRLERYKKDVEVRAGVSIGLVEKELLGPRLEKVNTLDPSVSTIHMLAMVLPLVMMVMCTFGATYPAIELTAGEREKGCAETTILLPIPRQTIAIGKCIAVTVAAYLALIINLAATLLTANPILSSWNTGAASFPSLALHALPLLLVFGLLLSLVYSSLFLLVGSHASTYREAQAYVTPIQFLAITPGLLSLVPGVEFDTVTALIPFYNCALAFRHALLGQMELAPVLCCLFSLAFLSLTCLHLTIRRLSGTAPILGFVDPDRVEKAKA